MSTLSSILSSLPVVFVLLAGSAWVLFACLHRGARLTPEPWYAGEHWVGTVLAPAIVILAAGAAGTLVEMVGAWGRTGIGDKHLFEAAVLALAFTVAAVALHRATPREQSGGRGARIIPMPGVPDARTTPVDEPPRPQPVDRAA